MKRGACHATSVTFNKELHDDAVAFCNETRLSFSAYCEALVRADLLARGALKTAK